MNKLFTFLFSRKVFLPLLYGSSGTITISILAYINGVEGAVKVTAFALTFMVALFSFGVFWCNHEEKLRKRAIRNDHP